jgi:DNA-binding transcriptional regulator GbsR (MarR family)
MVKTLNNTRDNMRIEKKMREVDLNSGVHSSVVEEHNEELREDIIRERIKNKNEGM